MEMNMDYQGFCHDFYPGDSADSKIDILPLPRVLWAQSKPRLRIRFEPEDVPGYPSP
jgi:hypothetical protein